MFESEPTHQTTTWDEVKESVLNNFNKPVVFFTSPDNGKEGLIFPSKYTYNHILKMNADDLKLLTVY